jgi:hypothetical protein
MKLNSNEDFYLNKCLYKGIEMMAFLSYELSAMMITKARKFEQTVEK